MRNIILNKSINFQECFFHDGVFSPFEYAINYRIFYPMLIIGEIGSVLNLHCKKKRSPHSYENQIKHEGVDIFIYLLLFGRMIEKYEEKNIFSGIEKDWDSEGHKIQDDSELGEKVSQLINKITLFLSKEGEKYYEDEFFKELFMLIKEVNFFFMKIPWQEAINKVHKEKIEEFTQVDRYTPDLWYNGSFYIDFNKLINFIEDNNVEVPEKRIYFLKRMRSLQNKVINKI